MMATKKEYVGFQEDMTMLTTHAAPSGEKSVCSWCIIVKKLITR